VDVAGDVEILLGNRYYIGDPSLNGSRRMGLNGSDFVVQKKAE
jgi:hypothetical protein